jgi:hypothetical protein
MILAIVNTLMIYPDPLHFALLRTGCPALIFNKLMGFALARYNLYL